MTEGLEMSGGGSGASSRTASDCVIKPTHFTEAVRAWPKSMGARRVRRNVRIPSIGSL